MSVEERYRRVGMQIQEQRAPIFIGKAYKSDNVRAFKACTYISDGNVKRRSYLGLIRLNNTRCGSQDVNRNVHFCCRNIKTEIGVPSANRMIHLESRVRENRTLGSESRGRKRL